MHVDIYLSVELLVEKINSKIGEKLCLQREMPSELPLPSYEVTPRLP